MLISLEVPGPGPARKLYFILDDSTSHLPFLTVLFWAAFWTSLWARKPLLPLRYLLMQWMTTLIVLVSVSQSACYKRWGSIIIRCCMSPSLVLTSSSLRFWPVLYRIMICLITFPYVVVYPICRQYCDAASCRYYRFNLFSALLLFFLFINYRASARKDNTPTILRTETQKHRNKRSKQRKCRPNIRMKSC